MKKKTKPENYLLILIVACVLTLTGNYCFDLNESQNTVYTNSGNIDFKESTLAVKSAEILIKVNNKNAVLLKNGEPVNSVVDEGCLFYELRVYEKDVFELDVRNCADKDITATVTDCEEKIVVPQKGTKMIANKGIVMLFKVAISD